MLIAIYSRKSKFTGKGDSVENQIEMCRSYIKTHFPNCGEKDIHVYEDEGYSAKNLDRPQFKQMIADNEKQKFDYIIVYRLDRISRSVSDFAALIEQLNAQRVGFVCIKEQFDTSTPMGRAMMYIASVFAQLERETIAERVRDNVHLLARGGRWLGGTTPTGFDSEKHEKTDFEDKTRTSYTLKVNPDEIGLVKLIYGKFLELRSMAQVERYFLNNDIFTKNGKNFNLFSIKAILTNPVYCTADINSYRYFEGKGCDLCCTSAEVNDGKNGFTAFNRTDSTDKRGKNPMNEWLIAVGTHEGVIPSADWIKTQELLEINKPADERKVHNSTCLLSGLIKCKCGSYMRPKYARANSSGERTFVYMCELKEKSKRKKCSIANVSGNTLDELVCTELLNYNKPNANVRTQLESLQKEIDTLDDDYSASIKRLEDLIANKKNEISVLIDKLAKSTSDETDAYINNKVKELDKQIKDLQAECEKLLLSNEVKEDLKLDLGTLDEVLEGFKKDFRKLGIMEKRDYIKKCVSKIVWEGEQADIFLVGKYLS